MKLKKNVILTETMTTFSIHFIMSLAQGYFINKFCCLHYYVKKNTLEDDLLH